MNVLIVEDEKQAAARLIKLLDERKGDIHILEVLDTVASAVNYLKSSPAPDLIFLDIQLGDGKSFEIFKQADVTSHIIFTTAFDEYALQAFKYKSIDYLLKPIKKAELDAALKKYTEHYRSEPVKLDINTLLRHFKSVPAEYKTRFLVKKGTRYLSLTSEEVAMAYTKDRVHFIKTFNGDDYLIDTNLEELEPQLDPDQFFKVNRQFIIHYKAIDQVFSWFDGKLKLTVKPAAYEDIVISRLRAGEFKKWMGR